MKINNSFKRLLILTMLIMSMLFTGCGSDKGSSNGGDKSDFTVDASAVSSNSIKITWTSHPDAKSYQVYSSTSSGSGGLTSIYDGSNLSYTATGLQCDTTYYFRVYINNSSTSGYYEEAHAKTLPASSGVNGTVSIYNYTIYPDDPITRVTLFNSSNQKVFEYTSKYLYFDDGIDVTDVSAGTYKAVIADNYDNTYTSSSFTVSSSKVYVTFIGDGLVVTGGIPDSDVQGVYNTTADFGDGNAKYWAYLASNGFYFVETDDEEIVETGEYAINGTTVTFWPEDDWDADKHTGSYSTGTQKLTAHGAVWTKSTI